MMRVSPSVSSSIRPASRHVPIDRPPGSPSSFKISQRAFTDYVRGVTPNGATVRYPLNTKSKIVGVYQSRGQRSHQEDTLAQYALSLCPGELQDSLRLTQLTAPGALKKAKRSASSPVSSFAFFNQPNEQGEESARGWEPSQSSSAGEVAFFGIFDGHGGGSVSAWLKDHLHSLIEDVRPDEVEEVVRSTQSIGGYFRRFQGGILSHLREAVPTRLSIPERLTLAFLKADRTILETIPAAESCGSTASIAILHSLETPKTTPFFESKKLSIIVAHCGDTRILLCPCDTGLAQPLTEPHHAETRTEAARLRRMSQITGGSVVDAFGESRWLGSVENTRAFGDGRWKEVGVTAEPQVGSRVINGQEFAFMAFVSDGVCSTISDQEIIDLCRNATSPAIAARAVVSFAEDLNSQDNCSCMVVPLAGWGKIRGVDATKDRRDFRRREAEGSGGRARRD